MPIRILIVDDSPAMRSMLRRVIELTGVSVDEFLNAGDGSAALALLAETKVDLILTDINMPVMNGEEFLRNLQQNGSRYGTTPVIVISTDATSNRVQRMLDLGAIGYLAKPFSPESLRTELENALGAAHV